MVQREHDIIDTQIAIEEMLDAKAQERERTILPDYFGLQSEEPEALPVPAAMIHHANQQQPGKRQGTNTVSCKYRDDCANAQSFKIKLGSPRRESSIFHLSLIEIDSYNLEEE